MSRSGADNPDLSEDQRRVLYEQATEPPFSSHLNDNKAVGVYVTADTGQPVFHSDDKFESGSGWPSFTQPINPEAVVLKPDDSHGLSRTEVVSADTGAHLGHVFDDGPEPSGQRFCINGLALKFIPRDD